MQTNLARFEELNTQVLGISVDSIYAHRAFAEQLGGLDFPLLADFHPKGEVAKNYRVWNGEFGFSNRAIIGIDAAGILRHKTILSPPTAPDIDNLLDMAAKLTKEKA